MTRRKAAQLRRNQERARAEAKAIRAKINKEKEKKRRELAADCLAWAEKITALNVARGWQA